MMMTKLELVDGEELLNPTLKPTSGSGAVISRRKFGGTDNTVSNRNQRQINCQTYIYIASFSKKYLEPKSSVMNIIC